MWIDLTDFQVYEYQYQIRQARPNVSFPEPITDENIFNQEFRPIVRVSLPEYDEATQSLINLPPVEINGVWTQQWVIEEATQEEIAQRLEQKRQSMNVTPFQAKAALLDADLLDDIEAMMADPVADRTVVLAWNNVTEFRRLSPMVAGIASALGWSDEQLDSLFAAAALKTA